jgi:hypothetical protein
VTTLVSSEPSTSRFLTVVGGDVDIPPGDGGRLGIVVMGSVDGGSIPVVVRNRTTEALERVEVSGTARDANGGLIATGSSQGFVPERINAGEWAFGYVYFQFEDLPSNAQFDLTAKGRPASDTNIFFRSVDLEVVEASLSAGRFGNRIVGIVSNPTDEAVSGPVSVDAICFRNDGVPIGTHRSFTDSDSIAANGTTSFTIDLFDSACPIFAIGSSGFSQ